ncbi:MAG: hypothetical protein J6A19_07620 [Oscillospiraceae bacterium]|nr:hypothetical protein [Oscillospiraceae bacterium]
MEVLINGMKIPQNIKNEHQENVSGLSSNVAFLGNRRINRPENVILIDCVNTENSAVGRS